MVGCLECTERSQYDHAADDEHGLLAWILLITSGDDKRKMAEERHPLPCDKLCLDQAQEIDEEGDMQSFSELEEENSRTNVRFSYLGFGGAGVLTIAGKDTVVKLSTSQFCNFDTDDNGWFDLALQSGNGDKLFLHNALQSGMTSYGTDVLHFETTIFPNYIAFGADHLSDTGQLTTIGFSLQGLDNFFHFEVIERHSLYKTPQDILSKLKETSSLEEAIPKRI